MTAQDDPYVRVYYRIIDDSKFSAVYDDDQALALWLRLLLHADAMYPAPAILPHGVRRKALDKLVEAELVDLGTGHRYRIHGLAAERERRAEAARFAADAKHHGIAEAQRRQSERHAARSAPAVRPQSERSADGLPLRSDPNRTNPNRAEPTRASAGVGHDGSKNRDEELLAAYRAKAADTSLSEDIRRAASVEVERLEGQRVH